MLALLVAVLAAPAGYRWQVVALDGGGPVQAVAVSSHDPALVVAGGERSGCHRSTDGGRTWEVANYGTRTDADVAVAALVWHPTDPRVVYAATGRGAGRPTGEWGGLLVSVDGGQSWSVRSRAVRFAGRGPERQTGQVLLTDPFAPDVLWAATAWDGVMVSRDRGGTWQPMGLAGRFLTALGRTADGTLYAAAESRPDIPGGLYVRRHGSQDWRRVYDGPVRDLAVAPSDPGRILIATPDAGLVRSEDYGAHWVNVTPGGFTDKLIAARVVTSPSHPVAAIAAGTERPWQPRLPGLLLSLDTGRTWREMVAAAPTNVDVGHWWAEPDRFAWEPRVVAFDPASPRRVWCGDQLTVWVTHDGAATWFSGHQGLRTATVRQIVPHPSRPGAAYLGCDGIGAFEARLEPAGVSPLGGNLAAVTDVIGLAAGRSAAGDTVYLTRGKGVWRQSVLGSWSAGGEAPGPLGELTTTPGGALVADCRGYPLQLSRDRGATWSDWGRPPLSRGRLVSLRAPVFLDRAGRLVAAYHEELGPYLSRDGGENWGPIGAGLPDIDAGGARHKHLVALAAGQGALFAASRLALWRTVDQGAHWERIFPRPVAAVAISPEGRLYVAASADWRHAGGGLYASDDLGDSLTRIDSAWPLHHVITCLAPDPRVPGRLWVGTDGNAAAAGTPSGSDLDS